MSGLQSLLGAERQGPSTEEQPEAADEPGDYIRPLASKVAYCPHGLYLVLPSQTPQGPLPAQSYHRAYVQSTHTACALFENIPVPVSPPPPSPNVAVSHGLVGSPGWLPASSCAPLSPQSSSLCVWMPAAGSSLRALGQYLPPPRGLPWPMWFASIPTRPSPEDTVLTAGHRDVCPSSAVSAVIPQLSSSGTL